MKIITATFLLITVMVTVSTARGDWNLLERKADGEVIIAIGKEGIPLFSHSPDLSHSIFDSDGNLKSAYVRNLSNNPVRSGYSSGGRWFQASELTDEDRQAYEKNFRKLGPIKSPTELTVTLPKIKFGGAVLVKNGAS